MFSPDDRADRFASIARKHRQAVRRHMVLPQVLPRRAEAQATQRT